MPDKFDRRKAKNEAKCVLENYIVLDTETTDLDGEVIELSAIDPENGKIIIDTLVYSDKNISPYAFDVHNISKDDLIGKPSFSDSYEIVKTYALEHKKKITSFNKSFDFNVSHNSLRGVKREDLALNWGNLCCMYISARFFGSTNYYGSISLSDSCEFADIDTSKYKAHRALADTQMTIEVLKYICSAKV